MAEWSIAAVLKTVELRGSGGSNPSLSATKGVNQQVMRFAPFSTPRTSIAYKTINEPLESLDESSKGLAYLSLFS